ncbi:MAG TPA: GyrI-like domain-containing protein, partial [Streptomyces sp.]|nr:GyrI-like domain-containing protein [Streptomyces sp.]
EELRGMLRLRQTELEAAQEAAAQRLTQVEARLRMIEGEGRMSSEDVVIKELPAVRVAELTGTAGGFEPKEIAPVIGPLYERLCRELDGAGLKPIGPGIAYYEVSATGDSVVVHAGMPVSAPAGEHAAGFTVRDLPGVDSAATVVHHGSMDRVMPTLQMLARWMDANGYRPDGSSRELYLDCGAAPETWVTEIQQPVARA